MAIVVKAVQSRLRIVEQAHTFFIIAIIFYSPQNAIEPVAFIRLRCLNSFHMALAAYLEELSLQF